MEFGTKKVSKAIDFGESLARNVSFTAYKIGGNFFQKSSPEFIHAQFLKPRREVTNLADIALTSAFAARKLIQDGNAKFSREFIKHGLSNADISNSILSSQCPIRPRCFSNDRYRTFDGSCNHRQNSKYGQALTPLQRILPNAYADKIINPRIAKSRRPLPSARLVSTSVTTIDAKKPSRVNNAMFMALGQFIDHDLAHVPMRSKYKLIEKQYLEHNICIHFVDKQ